MIQTAVTPDASLTIFFSMPLECKSCIVLESSVFSSHSNVVSLMTAAQIEDTKVLLFSVRVVLLIAQSSLVGFPCMIELCQDRRKRLFLARKVGKKIPLSFVISFR